MHIRRAEERGHANHGWLDTHHTFSFARYYDPRHMGFGPLRVINEDRVIGGRGFGTHPHRDMEIISYVLEGALEHKDSSGGGGVIKPGDVQVMSAGSGVVHSEYNASDQQPVHFLQIWIQPQERGVAPRYDQRSFADQAQGTLRLVVSPDGAEGSLSIHQQARIYRGLLGPGDRVEHTFEQGRGWVQVARGALTIQGETLKAGDGVALTNPERLTLSADQGAEFLLFDMPER